MVSKKGPLSSSSKSRRTSRKSVKKVSSKLVSKKSNLPKSDSVMTLLQKIEAQQRTIIANQRKESSEIKASGEKIEEEIIESETNSGNMPESVELDEIKRLEEDIKQGAQPSPLRRITYRDVTRGLVGAFIAVVNQFAFADGFNIASSYSIFQSTLLFITSFFIIVLFIYYTGFRKVDDKFVFKFLPIRAGILYLASILVSTIVPFIFNTLDPSMPFSVIYGTIASISVLAVLGAGTADLIGKA